MKQTAGQLILKAIQTKITERDADIYCLKIEIENHEAVLRHKQARFDRVADEGLNRIENGQRPGTSQILGQMLLEIDAAQTQLDFAQAQLTQLVKAA